MLRKGRLARLARLGGMAAGLVGDAAAATTHLVTDSVGGAAASFHRHAATRMLRVFGEMKGLPLKAGQILSYIDEMLPEEHRHIYNSLLGNLQTHTPPMEWDAVQAILREELEGRGPEELFEAFEVEPLAAASIGQVYWARMHDGREVAVKVQYPGVAEAIASDLQNLSTLMSAMNKVMRGAKLEHFVEDIVHRIADECDYELEAQSQQLFVDAYRDDPEVIVPELVPELCRKRVLVSELLHAQHWQEMLSVASPELKRRYGRTIFRFVFQSLFCHGMFNGDPHPGNYMFYPDGRVAFIDYGCVQRYSPEQTEAFQTLRAAVVRRETEGPGFSALVARAFALPDDLDEEVQTLLEDYLRLSFEPATAPQPYRFRREYTRRLLEKGMEAKAMMTKKMILGRGSNVFANQSSGVAFLGRINFGLGSILSSLDTEANFNELLGTMG